MSSADKHGNTLLFKVELKLWLGPYMGLYSAGAIQYWGYIVLHEVHASLCQQHKYETRLLQC